MNILTEKNKNQTDNKTNSLVQLCDHFFKDIENVELDEDFLEKAWGKLAIKKIAMKIAIKDGSPFFDSPYGHHHGREAEVKYNILQTCRKYELPNCSFLIFLNDNYKSDIPAFSAIRADASQVNNIPMPMGNQRHMGDSNYTPLMGWDEYAENTILKSHRSFYWKNKIGKALFRGQYKHQTWALGKYRELKSESWLDVNRGALFKIASERKDIFDVAFTRVAENPFEEEIPEGDKIDFIDQQQYKYIISMGTNANWAENLRNYLFSNSLVVKHEGGCVEWFYPLIKPWEHYMPTNMMLDDLAENVEWAIKNDLEVKKIIKRANVFAKEYINEETMFLFTKILIEKYAKQFAK